jgi:3-dehydroquinate synthase
VRVRVETASRRAAGYDVIIRAGAVRELPSRVASAAPAERYAVLAPDDVAGLYGDAVIADLRGAGRAAELLAFPAGEASKSRDVWGDLTDRMLAHRFGRDSCVIALGGGVACDLAGFVAATYMRGLPVVQVPTTLLAMIDASVGGKTGVDTAAGKNLVGAFHHPALVIADPELLHTLPGDGIRAGLAEAVKHGAILDGGYLDWIAERAPDTLDRDPATLEHLIAGSVAIKAAVVTDDPYERGRRALLNFGHTVGHALELLSGFTLAHGYAVAAGMVVEAEAGELLGISEAGTADRIRDVLRRCGLPHALPAVPADAVIDAMALDKKTRRAVPRCALPRRPGSPAPAPDGGWAHEVPDGVLAQALGRTAEVPRDV